MVAGLGCMQALQEHGLLDLTTYICSLSGSTWGVGGWLESRLSVSGYLNFLKKSLAVGLLGQVNTRQIIKTLSKKLIAGQPIFIEDVWGCLIAQKALSGPRDITQVTLQNYRTLPADGSLPVPIYNCVCPLESSDEQLYRWIEWTPFEIRCPYLKTAIPVASLGSYFEKGKVMRSAPVAPLSYGFGIWAAVMAADLQDVLGELDYSTSGFEQEVIAKVLQELESHYILDEASEVRPFSAYIPNWNYKLGSCVAADVHDLTLMDCGFLCNLPLPPALDRFRGVDIIILVDATMGSSNFAELQIMQNYAQKNNLPFPVINPKTVDAICSVYKPRPGSEAPTLIYFPLVANPAYKNGWDPKKAAFTDILNLQYTPQQVELLSGLMYTACRQNISTIWSVINSYTKSN